MKTRLLFTGFFLLNLFCYTAHSQIYRVSVVPQGTNKCGYVNLKGEFIVEALYPNCFPFTEEGTALTTNKKYSKFHLFDRMGNEIIPETKIKIYVGEWSGIPSVYSGGILRIKQNRKWGGLNNDGKLSVSTIYDELTDFNGGYALGKRHKVYYVVDKNGKEIPIEGHQIIYIKHFTEGLAPIEVKGQKYGFVDTLGKVVIAPQFKTVGYFSGGYAWARTKSNTIGFINKKGEWVVEPQFAVVNNFDKESGMAMVKKKAHDVQYGYIDTTGTIQYFKETQKTYGFSEGLAIGKKDYKFGYLNNKGEWVIEPQFDQARKFINGFAAVKIDGRWGLINKEGNYILQPDYKSIGDVAVIK